MKKALITGGGGFIGSHLAKSLKENGWKVVIADVDAVLAKSNLNYLKVDADIIELNLVDYSSIARLDDERFDIIYHMAGNANVPLSVKDPRLDFEANVVGTLNILEYARSTGSGKVVFPSTASVYKAGVRLPIREDAPKEASSPYGAAKVAAENYCKAYVKTYGMDVTIVRFFNVYGPLMRRWLIYDLVKKLIKNPRELEMFGDGEQVREYLHVEDAARALIIASNKGRAGEAYNIGTGKPMRIIEIAGMIIEIMGLKGVKIKLSGKSWPGDIKKWYAATDKCRAMGFQPQIELKEGLRETIDYIRNECACD